MTNYVQLGQGLRDLGQSLSAGYDFINTQNQLQINQQNADTNKGYLKLQQEQQAEAMRIARNKESSRKIAQVFQGAVQSGAGSLGEYFAKDPAALDTVLNSYAASNSFGRQAAGGKPLAGTVDPDGMFSIHTVDTDGTKAPLLVDGQPFRVDNDQLYTMGLREMAASGIFETVSGLKALESKKAAIPPEQYEAERGQLTNRLTELRDKASQAGVDVAEIESDMDAAGIRHAQVDTGAAPQAPAPTAGQAPTPPLLAKPDANRPVSLGDSTVSRFFPNSVGAAMQPVASTQPAIQPTPALSEADSRQSRNEAWLAEQKARAPSQFAVIDHPDAPISAKLGAVAGVAVKDAADIISTPFKAGSGFLSTVGSGLTGSWKPENGAPQTTKPETSAPAPTISPDEFIRRESKSEEPQTPDAVAEKTQKQMTENPPRSETHVRAIVNRGVSTLSAPPKQQSAGTDVRDAYFYSMGMTAMGLTPDKEVIGNLMAGDTFNGYNADKRGQDIEVWREQNLNARFAASQELQYAQMTMSRAAGEAQLQGNSVAAQKLALDTAKYRLAARKQTLTERDANIERASQQYGYGKDKSEFEMNTSKFQSALTGAIAMTAGDLAKQGYNTNAYLTELSTEPAYVNLMAKWLSVDMQAAKHNKGVNWTDKPRTHPTDFMLKIHAMRDPEGSKAGFVDARVNDAIDQYITANGGQPDRAFVEAELRKAESDYNSRLSQIDAKDINWANSYE